MDPNRLANVGTPDFDGRPRQMVSARGGGHRFWLGHMVSTSSTAVVVNWLVVTTHTARSGLSSERSGAARDRRGGRRTVRGWHRVLSGRVGWPAIQWCTAAQPTAPVRCFGHTAAPRGPISELSK